MVFFANYVQKFKEKRDRKVQDLARDKNKKATRFEWILM